MGELLGKCLGLISGAKWRDLKVVTGIPFSHKASSAYTGDIQSAVKEHFATLEKNGRLNKGLLNPVDDLRLLPFWIVVKILYGELTSVQRSTLLKIMDLRERLFQRVIQGGLTRFSWSQYLSSQTNTDLQTYKLSWTEFNTNAYLACNSSHENPPIVSMYQAVEDGNISLEELLQTLDEMLFANLDVTMGGLSWNLVFLAAHQNVQDEIREQVLAKNGGECKTYLESSNTLLAASVLESARLKPLAAFSVAQSAPSLRLVGDYLIPAGTNFIVDTHALNILNPFWGDDGEVYRPARFLERKASDLRYQYWRFGFGPRQCAGKYPVDVIIRVVLAELLGKWRIRLVGEGSWGRKESMWILHPDTEIRCEKL
jgi:cytochrome P450